MAELIFDIETVPTQKDDIKMRIHKKVMPPKTLKKEESIAAWYNGQEYINACNKAYTDTALSSMFGEVCAIGWMWSGKDQDTQSIVRTKNSGMTERELLESFFSTIVDQSRQLGGGKSYIEWIGHNVVSFDFPFLMHRAIINRANMSGLYLPRNLRPTGNRGVFDTMTEWSGWGKRVSLSDLAAVMGCREKTMDAKNVFDCFDNDEKDTIASYVENDVSMTFEVYIRMQSYLGRS